MECMAGMGNDKPILHDPTAPNMWNLSYSIVSGKKAQGPGF